MAEFEHVVAFWLGGREEGKLLRSAERPHPLPTPKEGDMVTIQPSGKSYRVLAVEHQYHFGSRDLVMPGRQKCESVTSYIDVEPWDNE